MRRRRNSPSILRRLDAWCPVAVVALCSLVAASSAFGSAGQSRSSGFKVASTLDGKSALPHRIEWLGLPTLPAKKIAKVEFLIDGRLRWVEHAAPYVYGGNEGSHRSYLVTSWLSPGAHHSTVRAVAVNGQAATDTVTARVVAPPKVPAALAGTWQRTFKNTSAAGSVGNPTDTLTPPGRYRISFDRPWIKDVFPCSGSPCAFNSNTGAGGEFISDWTPAAHTFIVRGQVTIQIFHDTDRLGGSWCYDDGPSATYNWSVSGHSLKLRPVGGRDACPIRGFIWAGTWKRAG
jgi:hypothetical protein